MDSVEYVTQQDDIVEHQLSSAVISSYSAKHLERIDNSLVDDKPALQHINRISRKEKCFNDKELVSLCEILPDNEIIKRLLLSSKSKFNEEALNELDDLCIDEDIILVLSKRSGIPYQNPYEYMEDMLLTNKEQSKKQMV